jgi:two-component system LytT family response regulator
MKAIIVDDEPDMIEVLQLLLTEKCPQVEIVATANNVNDGLAKISFHDPHVVFLDIEMPGKNGFDLLQSLPKIKFHTIIVSAYVDYAIKAIKFSALDYILKPVDVADLVKAVEKVDPKRMHNDPRLKHLNQLLEKDVRAYDKLMIPSSRGFKNVQLDDIVHMESQAGNYCTIYLKNGNQELLSKAMNYFEEILAEHDFFRINRSHLVNLYWVKSYINSTGEIQLTNGLIRIVSTRKRSVFRSKMEELVKK